MIISEKNRREISKYLFKEGVLYAKKDFNLPQHPLIESVPNLQFLTNEGIDFLRTYLNLPSEIVPATLKKQQKPLGRPFGGPSGDRPRGPPRFEGEKRFGDRDGYRGGPRSGGELTRVVLLLITSLLSGILLAQLNFEETSQANDVEKPFWGPGAGGGRPGFGRGAGGYGGGAGSAAGSDLP
ncbi:Small ribosomal subunit protein eS10y [Cardamine amara subsp. amara]|uniref:Small ribosomal subunit protein eS10y n=1 Tax=Cardamine amara subsp. amara TaxID=228776 RepID=A0ABD1C832_CARAN